MTRQETLSSAVRSRLERAPQAKLPQARRRRAGQEHLFPIAAQLLNAFDHVERARLLVQLPDIIVASHGMALIAACREAGFPRGADFVEIRTAALSARRDERGRLPADIAASLNIWTDGFAAVAGRED